MAAGGAVLRFGSLFLRILQFCCAGLVLGIFSYFLSVMVDHHLVVARKWQAVEGLAGAATLYTIFAVICTLFLGGKTFFGILAVLLDLCFIGAFVAIAWFTRHGTNSCRGDVRTPLGDGPSTGNAPGYSANGFGLGGNQNLTYFPNLRLACRLNKTVFAASIIAIFLFLLTAIWQIMMVLHHRKEKKLRTTPTTTGRSPMWKRKQRHTKDVETVGVIGTGTGVSHVRPSHETEVTLGNNNTYVPEPKYVEPAVPTYTSYASEPKYVEPIREVTHHTHTHTVPEPVPVVSTHRHNNTVVPEPLPVGAAHRGNNTFVPEPKFGRPDSRGLNAYAPDVRHGEPGYTQPAYNHPVYGQPGYGMTDVTYHDRTTANTANNRVARH